jgi:esterase/lipase
LQVFDFIEAKFAILMVFEFFLTTAEFTEIGAFLDQELSSSRAPRLRGEFSSGSKHDNGLLCADSGYAQ